MAGLTNRGTFQMLSYIFNAVTLPTNFFAALITAGSPSDTTNIKSDLTEASGANGYTTGGLSLSKNTTDFPSILEDDANHLSSIKIKNLTWTAAGGLLPSTTGATYLILTDDNATQGSRVVFGFWSLGSARQVSDTQQLQIQNAEMRIVNT